ncbi:MAG: trypsin-like peptidase domain-containing protein [Prochloron sp. SP5CPC1]|nr:trypsin-like peptidase domain-containing protein [Candidatus Paraprochloron terpiosi SP5CPC1]
MPIYQQNQQPPPYYREIQHWAEKITVLIERYDDYEQDYRFAGSGVILRGSYPNQYYVIATHHSLELEDRYRVRIGDDTSELEYSEIQQLKHEDRKKDQDLAIFEFFSQETFPTATLGNPFSLYPKKSTIYLYGWVEKVGEQGGLVIEPVWTAGTITKVDEDNPNNKYPLEYEDVDARKGMSGGPLLNEYGCLVGIHGGTISFPHPGEKKQYVGIAINRLWEESSLVNSEDIELAKTRRNCRPDNL